MSKPTLFKDALDYCIYTPVGNTTKNESVQLFSNDWLVEEKDFKISFKFCGDNNGCPKGSIACVHQSNEITVQKLGNMFVMENGTVYSKNGDFCKKSKNYSLVVHFTCNITKDEPVFTSVSSDGCEYHVQMTDPKCKSLCSTVIHGKLVSLNALAGIYTVKSKKRNFSITLCDTDPVCNLTDINACELEGLAKIPISSASGLRLFYDGDNNEFVFKSNTKKMNDMNSSKIDKRFELTLKCDWEKDVVLSTDIKYTEKQTQGQKYDFELESSFGCIKKSVPCVLLDSNLIYNISGLYTEHNTWSTKNHNGSLYFLQICGPIELSRTNRSCRSTHAQICENFGHDDINRGAVLRHLEVHNDVLTATIENGKRCNNDEYYSSSINFICNFKEEGPSFLDQKGCRTFFQWKTPHACPRMNPASCAHMKRESHKCTFYHRNSIYDLTALADVQRSINLHDEQEVLINLCGSVVDREAPCFKGATIALKTFKETNIKHRLVSLGKFYVDIVRDENLILEYATGALCEKNYVDYTSEIRFKCSQVEKNPILLEERDCRYVFLWETRHACPKNHNDCSIEDKYNDKKLDLNQLSQLQLGVSTKAADYKFNLCENNYTRCLTGINESCAIMFFNHSNVKILPDVATLQWTLPELCENDNQLFNKLLFHFVCDNVIKSDRVISINITNCSANVEYRTNLVCSTETAVDAYQPYIENKERTFPKHVLSRKILRPEQNLSDCLVKSPFTNEYFPLNRTVLNYIHRITHCPKVEFNSKYQYVSVTYNSEDKCETLPDTNVLYETVFKCSKESSIVPFNDSCYISNNYLRPDYCKFFSSRRPYGSTHIGLIVGLCLSLLVIVSVIVFMYLKKFHFNYKPCDTYSAEYKNVQD